MRSQQSVLVILGGCDWCEIDFFCSAREMKLRTDHHSISSFAGEILASAHTDVSVLLGGRSDRRILLVKKDLKVFWIRFKREIYLR